MSPPRKSPAAPLSDTLFADASISAAKLAPGAAGANLNDGNPVGIGGASALAGAHFAVGSATQVLLDQPTGAGVSGNSNFWQSFTAPGNMLLTDVEFFQPMPADWGAATLSIHEGEGTGGAVLRTQPVTQPATAPNKRLTLASPVQLSAGAVYTFAYSGSFISFTVSSANPYAGGRASIGSGGFDLRFRVYGEGASFIVTDTGRVGIGTPTPSEALDVAGNIRSSGSISAAGAVTAGSVSAGSVNATGTVSATNFTGNGAALTGIWRLAASDGSPLQALSVDNGGRVSIAGATSGPSLQVTGGIRATGGAPGAFGVNNRGYAFHGTGDDDSGLFSTTNGRVSLYVNGTEEVAVTSTGVGIGGQQVPRVELDVLGDAAKPGGGSWSSLSDARLKKNVRTLAGALDRLLALRGVSFGLAGCKPVLP